MTDILDRIICELRDMTRRDDAALAVARLREHCADYGYGFDATESRGPAIAATMTGGTVVEIVITVRVEEPDGAVRSGDGSRGAERGAGSWSRRRSMRVLRGSEVRERVPNVTPLDNLRRLVAGWRGEWRVDAHEGITLSHDGDEWPIGALDGDAVVMLVALLNAIRPAVDGATAEIERLTAELAAARAVPPDVAFAIDTGIADFIDGHAKRIAGDDWALMDADDQCSVAAQVHDVLNHLRADADGAVIDGRASQPATVDIATAIKSVERIESNSKALGYSADYMAAIDRVLSCLRAVAENGGPLTSTMDGGTSQSATVGGLLATAPVGSIVEWKDGDEFWHRMRAGEAIAARWYAHPPKWSPPGFGLPISDLRLPARLVPAHLADADPASRGELLATVDRCGVCAQVTANQNHEPVGAGLPMEPTCDACLAPEHRPEVPDVR